MAPREGQGLDSGTGRRLAHDHLAAAGAAMGAVLGEEHAPALKAEAQGRAGLADVGTGRDTCAKRRQTSVGRPLAEPPMLDALWVRFGTHHTAA